MQALRCWKRVFVWLAPSLLLLALTMGVLALVLYPAEYVRRTLLWQGADVGDRLRFPVREVQPRSGATELPVALQSEHTRFATTRATAGCTTTTTLCCSASCLNG